MIYAFLLLFAHQVFCDDFSVVVTPVGPVKGRVEEGYSTFFGIPYALVDEENPFGVSSKQPDFVNPFEALDPSVKCPQATLTAEGILQCLRLNIYVPQKRDNKTLPVFVWFHGGGFFFGSAGDYGGKYLIKHDIIVVTANYRLGPYGFLCLNDPKAPGNQGLKDQVDALKWIRDNIEAFGGDSSKVTIAGESYGGGSVDLHLYSNFEKYFDKAVVQSGGAQVEAMFIKPDFEAAIKLAKLFNHTTKKTSDALKFLAKLDPIELAKAFNSSGLLLRACKEKKFKHVQSFLTKDPFNLYKPSTIKDTPVLFGYNSKEIFAAVAGQPDDYFGNNKDIFFDKLNRNFDFKQKDLRSLVEIVKKFYLGSRPMAKENILPVTDFVSDFMLNHAAEHSVTQLVDQGANVYKYIFSYVGNSPFKNVSGVGAYHSEELQYLFEMKTELTEPEHIMMRDRMTTLWANFVKYGNPTPETSSLLPVQWTSVPKDSRPYMNIDKDMAMLQDVYHDRIAFWDLFWKAYWRNSKILC